MRWSKIMNGVFELEFKNFDERINFENETGINIDIMDLVYSKSPSSGNYYLEVRPKLNNPRRMPIISIKDNFKTKDLITRLKGKITDEKLKDFYKKANEERKLVYNW